MRYWRAEDYGRIAYGLFSIVCLSALFWQVADALGARTIILIVAWATGALLGLSIFVEQVQEVRREHRGRRERQPQAS